MPSYNFKKFEPVKVPTDGDWGKYSKLEDAEFARVNDHAKSNNTRVGRTFKIPCADSYAYYQIIGQTKHLYNIVVLEVGDCWTDRILGRGGKFSKTVIDPIIDGEDAWARIFSKNN
jgi:hypothetical protein